MSRLYPIAVLASLVCAAPAQAQAPAPEQPAQPEPTPAAAPTGASSLSVKAGTMRLDLPSHTNEYSYNTWSEPVMAAVASTRDVEVEAKGKSLALLFLGVGGPDEAVTRLGRFVGQVKGFRGAALEAQREEES